MIDDVKPGQYADSVSIFCCETGYCLGFLIWYAYVLSFPGFKSYITINWGIFGIYFIVLAVLIFAFNRSVIISTLLLITFQNSVTSILLEAPIAIYNKLLLYWQDICLKISSYWVLSICPSPRLCCTSVRRWKKKFQRINEELLTT